MIIAIEGVNGSGKTTQAKLLCEAIPGSIYSHHPSEPFRSFIFDNPNLNPKSQYLLFCAEMANNMPSINSSIQIVDRYTLSSGIYHPEFHNTDISLPVPDIQFILDVSTSTASIRSKKPFKTYDLNAINNLYKLSLGIHIDAEKSVEEVHAEILNYVSIRNRL